MTDDKSTEPNVETEPEDISPEQEKFEDAASIGDTYFLYESWSAWSINPETKRIAPVTRIYIGDLKGNVVFERSVVLTGVLDLISELTNTLENEIDKIGKLPGFALHIPHTTTHFMETLGEVEATVKRVQSALEKGKFLVGHGDK
jgi:hypothetical protein